VQTYFETIKCFDQEIFNLAYHKKRIMYTIGKNINLEEYIYPINDKLLKCKVLYNQNDILDIKFSPYKQRKIKSFKLIYCDTIIYNKKSSNRKELDTLFNKKENYDEIIIIKNNLITDTSIANIAIFYNNEWITPISPLLQGTTKSRYVDKGILKEKDITVSMLIKCKKIALLNAMIDFHILEDFTFHQ